MAKKSRSPADLASNRAALRTSEIVEKFEAGVALEGREVKSARARAVNLKGSWVAIRGGQAFLENANFARWAQDGSRDFDPRRSKKLLLHHREIEKIAAALGEKGLTAVPLGLRLARGRVKLNLAVVRGLRVHDRREKLKSRAENREIDRAIKTARG